MLKLSLSHKLSDNWQCGFRFHTLWLQISILIVLVYSTVQLDALRH
jgi:hypothetical protein